MKINNMTTEEKAKAYDEALERIKKELQSCGYTGCDTARQIFRFFPELQESEDERIRKEIINYFKCQSREEPSRKDTHNKWIAWLKKVIIPSHNDNDSFFIEDIKNVIDEAPLLMQSDKEKMIGWLEKQGEKPQYKTELEENEDDRIRKAILSTLKDLETVLGWDFVGDDVDILDAYAWLEKQGDITKLSEEEQNRFAKGVLGSCALSFIDYLDAHKYEGKMCVSNGECEDIENAFHNAMWDRLHRYYCKYIEAPEEPLENYDEAEKEKTDFVGDGFIECHADFLDFKEGNTYWLEYIGDDMYNVRSDNLLGKTYHITPCQLYTVFKKLTWFEKARQT